MNPSDKIKDPIIMPAEIISVINFDVVMKEREAAEIIRQSERLKSASQKLKDENEKNDQE